MKMTIQKQGWKELKQMRSINGGILPHGAVMNLVRKYAKHGTSFLMEDHLRYRLRAEALGKYDDKDDETIKTLTPPVGVVDVHELLTAVSSVTDPVIANVSERVEIPINVDAPVDVEDDTATESKTTSQGGLPKGSTIVSKSTHKRLTATCTTEATKAFVLL
jgi:hypothetical protein